MAWSLSSAGLVSPASFSNSADANTLDDYEEGLHTWSMSTDAGALYVPRVGYTVHSYTKIGDLARAGGKVETQGTQGQSAQSCKFSLPLTTKTGSPANPYYSSTAIFVRGHSISGNNLAVQTEGFNYYLIGGAGDAHFYIWNINNDGQQEGLTIDQNGNYLSFDDAFEFNFSACFAVQA